ncbi:MAG TPA: hypothetical protein DCZ95_00415 [Verrucomicrobia bacterium]|nr:MAG: hypothetical protein A2X46_03550 [Lentisphaerae bacterium GWF2_57_35]HBA82532.1 hypothetical protein [Verrucomicrobiota bacterium]
MAGYITSNALYWNNKSAWCSFSALLATITVEQVRGGDEVQTVLTLASKEDNGWVVDDAMMLHGAYNTAGNTLILQFMTKTNRPNSNGDVRFRGVLANVQSWLANGGIDMEIGLGRGEYRLSFQDANGVSLPVTVTEGSVTGRHECGDALNNGYWLVGAMNVDTGRASVCWDRTVVGVEMGVTNPVISRCAWNGQQIELEWPSFFGRRYAVQKTTNFLSGFSGFANDVRAFPPMNRIVDPHPEGDQVFYRLRTE